MSFTQAQASMKQKPVAGRGRANKSISSASSFPTPGEHAAGPPAPCNTSSPNVAKKELVPMTRPVDGNGNFLYGTIGRVITTVQVNHFKLTIDSKTVLYKYLVDVAFAEQFNSRKKIRPEIKRKVVDAAITQFQQQGGVIIAYGYDKDKGLLSSVPLMAAKTSVSLDDVKYSFSIEQETEVIHMDNESRFSEAKLATLDLLLLTNMKLRFETNLRQKIFFPPEEPEEREPVERNNFKEFWRGIFLSARPGEGSLLTLNVDITASIVVSALPLIEFFEECKRDFNFMNRRLRGLKPGLKILIKFEGRNHQRRPIVGVMNKTAGTHSFFDNETKRTVTLQEYYSRKYPNAVIRHPDLPLIKVKNSHIEELYPMEFCSIVPGQLSAGNPGSPDHEQLIRHISKLKPADRYRLTVKDLMEKFSTGEHVAMLERVGIRLSLEPIKITKARILPPVTMQAGSPINSNGSDRLPKDAKGEPGKFSLAGNLFYESRLNDIGTWAVIDTTGRPHQYNIREKVNVFRDALRDKHITTTREPSIVKLSASDAIEGYFKSLMENKEKVAFILFFVDNGDTYARVKQLGDCKYNLCTQGLNISKGSKMNKAYMENVVLKVNAKLNGANFVVAPESFTSLKLRPILDDPNEPVLIVGADVTHAGKGDAASKPSIAAVVANIDIKATKFVPVVTAQSRNGTMASNENSVQETIMGLSDAMVRLLERYHTETEKKPTRILFYRDGLSEGQMAKYALQHELIEIQKACGRCWPGYSPKITYIVVCKRNKTKGFDVDVDGDGVIKNVKNLHPGTVIESEITQSDKFFDWFMVPHFSPLGTARPTHYYVLYDDSKFSVDELQYLSFGLCHVFPRCPKAVSIPAPVYFAHLAAKRATEHLKAFDLYQPRRGLTLEQERRAHVSYVQERIEIDINRCLPNLFI